MERLLTSWAELNTRLQETSRSKEIIPLLRLATKAHARPQVVARIYARFNKLRSAEERRMIDSGKMPDYLK